MENIALLTTRRQTVDSASYAYKYASLNSNDQELIFLRFKIFF